MDLSAFINGTPIQHSCAVHMIRIGILETYSPRKVENQKDSDGQMIITPPQLNGLWIKQQSFRQCMKQFKWNYLFEGGEDYKEDDDYNDNDDKVNGIDIAISPTTNNKSASITMTAHCLSCQVIRIWLTLIWLSHILIYRKHSD
jgi:hypothetical protein